MVEGANYEVNKTCVYKQYHSLNIFTHRDFNLEEKNPKVTYQQFRFQKEHINRLRIWLQIPDTVKKGEVHSIWNRGALYPTT